MHAHTSMYITVILKEKSKALLCTMPSFIYILLTQEDFLKGYKTAGIMGTISLTAQLQ